MPGKRKTRSQTKTQSKQTVKEPNDEDSVAGNTIDSAENVLTKARKEDICVQPPRDQSKKRAIKPGQIQNPQKELAGKDGTTFKRLVEAYEDRQFKNGLKLVKQICNSKAGEQHSETWAYKGLCLLGLGKLDEAEQSVRKSLSLNLRSGKAWHSLGQVHRALHKYGEAEKCYRNASKQDPDNVDYIRDLSIIQLHTRDYISFQESRLRIALLRNSQKGSWAGLALSYHLLGDYNSACLILNKFRRSQEKANRDVIREFMKSIFNKKNDYDVEYSELIKYNALVLEEAGRLDEALNLLNNSSKNILDKVYLQERQVEILLQLNRKEEAKEILTRLLKRNPNNYAYLRQMEKACDASSSPELIEFYKNIANENKQAIAPCLLLLEKFEDQEFRKHLTDFLEEHITRRGFSLFSWIKHFYSVNKMDDIRPVLENLRSKYASEKVKSVYVTYFLANHFLEINDYDQGLKEVNRAIDDFNPQKNTELFRLKAKLLRKLKKKNEAVEAIKAAFDEDPLDKYIGCKYAKYLLMNYRIGDAVQIMAKFTKPGEKPLEYMKEIQFSWFFLELARTYRRQEKNMECLAACQIIDEIFEDLDDERVDFHLYALNKMRLTSHIQLLRSNVRNHKHFISGVLLAVDVCLDLHKESSERNPEKRKNCKTLSNPILDIIATRTKESQSLTDPLDVAQSYMNKLSGAGVSSLDYLISAFQLHQRRRKPLLQLQTLLKMIRHENGTQDELIKNCVTSFVKEMTAEKELDSRVWTVIDHHIEHVLKKRVTSSRPENALENSITQTNGQQNGDHGVKLEN